MPENVAVPLVLLPPMTSELLIGLATSVMLRPMVTPLVPRMAALPVRVGVTLVAPSEMAEEARPKAPAEPESALTPAARAPCATLVVPV